MEKFYIITEESRIHRKYFEHKQSVKDINEVVKNVMESYDIETNYYAIDNGYFGIYPTKNDLSNLKKQLCKDSRIDSLSFFKKNSQLYKELFERIRLSGLIFINKPLIQFEFEHCSKGRYRLFNIGDKLYASYESNTDFNNPPGFIEIKGSEFYKIVEEYNNSIKEGKQ
jgi:hypothetical protein